MALGLHESGVSLIFNGNPALRWLLGLIKQTAQGRGFAGIRGDRLILTQLGRVQLRNGERNASIELGRRCAGLAFDCRRQRQLCRKGQLWPPVNP